MSRPTDTEVLAALATLRAWLAPDVVPPADERIVLRPREPVPRMGGIKGRVVIEAGKRGELVIARIGGRPSVTQAELARWAESRGVTSARSTTEPHDPDSYESIVADA